MASDQQPEPRKPPTRRQIVERCARIRATWPEHRLAEGMVSGAYPRPAEIPVVRTPREVVHDSQ
jgi:hypothetical protein